jgi:flagellar assembly protein FliH
MANSNSSKATIDPRYGEIQAYSFNEISSTTSNHSVKEFQLQELSGTALTKAKVSETVIRKEREFANQTHFKISSVVKEHRGIIKQEEEDYQRAVEQEIERRLKLIQEESYQAGFNAGLDKGAKEAYDEAVEVYQEKISVLESYIEEVKSFQSDLFKKQKDEIYKMIKLLTKWVILKEVKNDQYIKDLFERLVLELNTKSNLLVKVNADQFEKMPEVLDIVQQRLGKLTNVRLEIEPDMKNSGIIIESDNGIVDGSLEAQFINLDKLFLSVGLEEEKKE